MKMTIWRVDAGPRATQETIFGYRTGREEGGVSQEGLVRIITETLRPRLNALASESASKIEISIRLIDEE